MRIRSLLSPAQYRRSLASARARPRSPQALPGDEAPHGVRGVAVSAAITAVVTLVITAALTPVGSVLAGALQSVSGAPRDAHGSSAPTVSATPTPDSLERVSDPTGALSQLVPASWGVTRAKVDTPYGRPDAAHTGPQNYVGAAMIAGDRSGISDPYGWDGSYVYFSASRDAATRLDLVGATETELSGWAEHFLEGEDWSLDGCVLAGVDHPEVGGYVTAMRRWENCKGLPDSRLWELAAASDDGEVLVIVQLTLGDVSEETASQIVTSFLVASEKLPAPPTGSGDQVIP
jgi:hypothetical protein